MSEYTEADKKTAYRLYKKGWGYLSISKIIGCASSTVRSWIMERGLRPHPTSGYSKKFKEKVMKDYENNPDLSMEKIAKRNGIYARTLSRWLYASDKKVRPQRPRIVDRDAIVRDLKAGLPKAEIARRNKCSESWVYTVQRGDG